MAIFLNGGMGFVVDDATGRFEKPPVGCAPNVWRLRSVFLISCGVGRGRESRFSNSSVVVSKIILMFFCVCESFSTAE